MFLDDGFKEAVAECQKKYNNPSTGEESLKNCNWNVIEFQTPSAGPTDGTSI